MAQVPGTRAQVVTHSKEWESAYPAGYCAFFITRHIKQK